MSEITIPLRYLLAVRLFSGKDATRSYLNGVYVDLDGSGTLVATDGHYCATVDLDLRPNSMQSLIIPNDAIDFYAKKAGRRKLDEAEVSISKDQDSPLYTLMGSTPNGPVIEKFSPVEGTYPPYRRIMHENLHAEGHPQFQWSFLVLFEKAAETLGTPKAVAHKAYLIPKGRDHSARVVLPGHPEFNGVVMPLESRFVDKQFPALTYAGEAIPEGGLV